MKFKNCKVAKVYLNGDESKYVVTKKGQVFNTKSGKELKWKLDSKGYPTVTLSHYGIAKTVRVHRLVAFGFVNNPKPKKYGIVNHIDGNKQNPYYKNLEWTDYSGNSKHAIENGLNHIAIGENHGKAKLTNNAVHEICKIMEDGTMTQREIAKKFNVNEAVIHEIKLGNNWKFISSQYNIENCKLGKGAKKLTDSTVIGICNSIVENELSLREISNLHHVKYDTVLSIFNHKSYKKITCNFDFTAYSHHMRYSRDLINEIQTLIKSGKSNKEIRKILKLPKGSKTNTMLYRERHAIE